MHISLFPMAATVTIATSATAGDAVGDSIHSLTLLFQTHYLARYIYILAILANQAI